ncbi:MAG TPA: glycosyltransferase family 4 protein [Candidatus Acidoferrum sp.]|nr:glycosyltransferase family 4 protein [Candidatus Acidoferrum sp.]
MKILALTNLFPPHHAGPLDTHCQSVVQDLRTRGHTILVLTSTHGLHGEQRDEEVHRCLRLNGAYGAPKLTAYLQLRAQEIHNTRMLLEAITAFQPEIVHVFSLHGLSKSLIFTLCHARVPVAYAVADHWLSCGLQQDPWLRYWNAPSLPFLEQSGRATLEMGGERGRLDSTAPTRTMKGYDRIPALYGDAKARAGIAPNSITAFRFDRIYFCSDALKQLTARAGFAVGHADVIYPGIAGDFVGQIKPAEAPIKKFLLVSPLTEESGAMTALKALQLARAARLNVTFHLYGRGESSYVASLRSFAVFNHLPVEFLTLSNLNTDLASVYKRHDALLHTPEWAEPFPLTALQAMACGLPVIGSTAGGAEELLRHGENALTYPPGDAEQLAARIQELRVSPALRCQMAETAQTEVMSKFNDTVVMDQVENFLTVSQAQTA